jgi:oligoendopeptidase F
MSTLQLPTSSEDISQATWEDLLPYFEELAIRPIDASNVEEWLTDWSRLQSLVYEANARAMFAYTGDTSNAAYEQAHLRYVSEIMPKVTEQHVRLAARLLDLGYTRPGLETMIRRFANQRELFQEENVPLMAETERLQSEYQKVTGTMTVEWEGKEVPLPRLQSYLQEQDRDVREKAWRLSLQPYIDSRDRLADIFDRLVELRQGIASNAGMASYRDYAHREKDRFDYTPEDCVRWQDAVEQTVVPAVARIRERRRQRLGVDALRPWDLNHDVAGRPPLRPFDEVPELISGSTRIFSKLDPELEGYFRTMADEGLLDLDSRKGKAPGGYCDQFTLIGRPIIFMNAVGVARDLETLLHEAGHAFHVFEWNRIEPIFQRFPGAEMCEVASMSMELLASPYLEREKGGFYDSDDARRARATHLRELITVLTHIASVDAFQHWIYTDPSGGDRDARDRAWLEIRSRFDPGVDWSGLDAQRVARWYAQIHFFCYPFYYIEYGLAQLAALQVWRASMKDPVGALRDYRSALALGATRPLPELFGAAGARLIFDPESMGELVALVEEKLAEVDD